MKITLLAEYPSLDGEMDDLENRGEHQVNTREEIKRLSEKTAEYIYKKYEQSRYVHAYLGTPHSITNDEPVYSVRYSPEDGGTFSMPEVFEGGVLI